MSTVPTLTIDWEDITLASSDNRLPKNLVGDEPTQELVNSVRENGLTYPILLRRLENGNFELIAGNRRLKAARLLKRSVPARVTDCDAPTALILAVADHATRRENAIADYQRIVALEEAGFSDADIVKVTGLDRNTLKKRRELSKLNSDLQQAVIEGKVKNTVAELASKLDRSRQKELVKTLRTTGKLTVENVKLVKKVNTNEAWDEVDIPDLPDTDDWRVNVTTRLQEAIDATPEDKKELIKRINDLMKRLK